MILELEDVLVHLINTDRIWSRLGPDSRLSMLG